MVEIYNLKDNDNVEFTDFGNKISYKRLFTSELEKSPYFMVTGSGVSGVLRENYVPVRLESIVNTILEMAPEGKVTRVSNLQGSRLKAFITFKDVELNDSFVEQELPDSVRSKLDYDFSGGGNSLHYGIEITNGYSGDCGISIIPIIYRWVCSNGVYSGEQIIAFRARHLMYEKLNESIREQMFVIREHLEKLYNKEIVVDGYLTQSQIVELVGYFLNLYKISERAQKELFVPVTQMDKISKWTMLNFLSWVVSRKVRSIHSAKVYRQLWNKVNSM